MPAKRFRNSVAVPTLWPRMRKQTRRVTSPDVVFHPENWRLATPESRISLIPTCQATRSQKLKEGKKYNKIVEDYHIPCSAKLETLQLEGFSNHPLASKSSSKSPTIFSMVAYSRPRSLFDFSELYIYVKDCSKAGFPRGKIPLVYKSGFRE